MKPRPTPPDRWPAGVWVAVAGILTVFVVVFMVPLFSEGRTTRIRYAIGNVNQYRRLYAWAQSHGRPTNKQSLQALWTDLRSNPENAREVPIDGEVLDRNTLLPNDPFNQEGNLWRFRQSAGHRDFDSWRPLKGGDITVLPVPGKGTMFVSKGWDRLPEVTPELVKQDPAGFPWIERAYDPTNGFQSGGDIFSFVED